MGWVGWNVVVEGGKIPTIPPSKESSKRAAMTWRMLIVEQVATIVSMDSSTLEAQVLVGLSSREMEEERKRVMRLTKGRWQFGNCHLLFV